MSGSRTIRHTVAAAALGAALFAGYAQANDQAHFTDVLKPHGHQRGRTEMVADAQGCGASGAEVDTTLWSVLQRCMRRKGWVLDHYERDLSSRPVRSHPWYDSGSSSSPSPDPSPSTGPDTAGMNTPTNPTWSGF